MEVGGETSGCGVVRTGVEDLHGLLEKGKEEGEIAIGDLLQSLR